MAVTQSQWAGPKTLHSLLHHSPGAPLHLVIRNSFFLNFAAPSELEPLLVVCHEEEPIIALHFFHLTVRQV